MFRKLLSFGAMSLITVATIFSTTAPSQAASYNVSPYFRPYTYQYRPITFQPYQYRPLTYQDFQYRVYRPYINRPSFGWSYQR